MMQTSQIFAICMQIKSAPLRLAHLVATQNLDARLFQLAQLDEIFFGNRLGILCGGSSEIKS
jgi:hypothetical protein